MHSDFKDELDRRQKEKQELFEGLTNFYRVNPMEVKVPEIIGQQITEIEESVFSRNELQVLIYNEGIIRAMHACLPKSDAIGVFTEAYYLLISSVWSSFVKERFGLFERCFETMITGHVCPGSKLLPADFEVDMKLDNAYANRLVTEAWESAATDLDIFHWFRAKVFHAMGLWALGFEREETHLLKSTILHSNLCNITFRMVGNKITIRDREVPASLGVHTKW